MSRIAAAGLMAAAAGLTLTLDVSGAIDRYDNERQKHRDQADQITAKVVAEDRDFTTEEDAALKEHTQKFEALTKRIESLRNSVKMHQTSDKPGESRTRGRDSGAQETADEAKDASKAYRSAMDRYIRFGMQALDEEQRSLVMGRQVSLTENQELRDLSALTGAAAGFTVANETQAEIEKAMLAFSGVAQSSSRERPTATGADLPWPTVNDTSNEGEQVAENVATTTASAGAGDPTFGQVMLKSYLYSSKLVKVPIQLLQDSEVNIDQLMGELFGERLGRITNRKFTVGTGANEPQGIVTGSTLGKTAAAVAAITYGELVDLQHSVDPAYRGNAQFMFHDTTWGVLRKIVDSTGRPIWQPNAGASMADGPQGLLLGQKFVINQHMAVPATGAKTVLYGDFSKYLRRRVKGLTLIRLAERFAEQFQVGFVAFLRADGRVINAGTNPIKHLIQA